VYGIVMSTHAMQKIDTSERVGSFLVPESDTDNLEHTLCPLTTLYLDISHGCSYTAGQTVTILCNSARISDLGAGSLTTSRPPTGSTDSDPS